MNVCSPLIRPPHLDGYDGPSLCDCWYAFHPGMTLGRTDPANPAYKAGDCPYVGWLDDYSENTGCYVKSDILPSFSCGYPLVYTLEVFDTSEGWKHAYGSRTVCAKCASRMKRDSRLEFGIIRVKDIDGSVYWEGRPIQCDYCDAEIQSAYGVESES